MNFKSLQIAVEGGSNMRDIHELHQSEIGEIIWQHKSGATNEYISHRLRVKLWQVENYIKTVKEMALNNHNPVIDKIA